MADQTEKPKLGTRPPLGLKRTVETGKVKQSFSHGRSNTVVVEVKKRRILGRPGEAPPAEAPKPEPVAEAPKPAPKPAAPARAAPPVEAERHRRAARNCRSVLLREAEEERLRLPRGAPARGPKTKVARARKRSAARKKIASAEEGAPRRLA